MTALPDPEALIASLAESLRPRIDAGTAMVGIHTGGVWVAERLHAALGLRDPLATLDAALYRDDFDKQGLAKHPKRSRIPFSVDGRALLLVDDVLFTGRTVRAAMNELFDYGRPASIALVVLADRGGRELPIGAAYCGATLDLPAGARLRLRRDGANRLAFALETAK